MQQYPKIQGLFKRDEKTHKFLEGQYSLPEFEYLKDNKWVFTEKVDGTNIRVEWDTNPLDDRVLFGGRTHNASIPTFLLAKLQELFPVEKFKSLYPEISMTLYGEGYGARIQKGGGKYIPDGVDFVLFDVKIENWWLKRDGIEDIAEKLEIEVVPIRAEGTIPKAVEMIKTGLKTAFCNGDFFAEGLVLKPKVQLFNRKGHRIITKLKHKDF